MRFSRFNWRPVTGNALPLSVGHLDPRVRKAFIGVERFTRGIGALGAEVSDGDGGIVEYHDLQIDVVNARVLRGLGLGDRLGSAGDFPVGRRVGEAIG